MDRDVALACQVAEQGGSRPQVFTQVDRAWRKALAELGPTADFVTATSTFTTATDALHSDELRASARKEDAS